MKLREICHYLESYAQPSLQESYDNSGLLVGDPETEISGAVISLDVTEDVIQEAIDKKYNLVIAHHPIIFKGLKKITGKTYVERTVIKAIKNDIAIYAIHTNLDNVVNGVNAKIAEKLGLIKAKILAPKIGLLMKLVVFVPVEHTGKLLDSLYVAGAGDIGNYSNCSFRVAGKGTFKGNLNSNPNLGQIGVYEEVDENRVEVIFPSYLKNKILSGMRAGHIYEEIAYYLTETENEFQDVGAGMVGELKQPISEPEFLAFLKETMKLDVIRHTLLLNKNIGRIAVCGGSGGFLLKDAINQRADVFITSDYKYHEFFDAEGKIIIADIGHFESEQFTKDLIQDIISKKFPNFASCLSEVKTNPVNYYY